MLPLLVLVDCGTIYLRTYHAGRASGHSRSVREPPVHKARGCRVHALELGMRGAHRSERMQLRVTTSAAFAACNQTI